MSFGIAPPENPSFFENLLIQDTGSTVMISLTAILLISAMLGWFAQNRIRYYRQIKLRVLERKIKAKHLIKILEGLAKTNCDQRVRELLGQRLLELIEHIMDINPQEPGVKIIHDAAQKLIALPARQTTHDIAPAHTDAEVKSLQNLVLAALAQIKKMPRRGWLTYSECKTLETHLKKTYIQVEIDAHIQCAELAHETGDRMLASNHFRIAQNKLAYSKYHGKEKKEQMTKIGDSIRALFPKEEQKKQ